MNLAQLKEKYPNFEEYADRWLCKDKDEVFLYTEWACSSKETVCFCRSLENDSGKLWFAGRLLDSKGVGEITPNDAVPQWVCDFVKSISDQINIRKKIT